MVGSGSICSDIHKKQPHGFGEKDGHGFFKAQLYRKLFLISIAGLIYSRTSLVVSLRNLW